MQISAPILRGWKLVRWSIRPDPRQQVQISAPILRGWKHLAIGLQSLIWLGRADLGPDIEGMETWFRGLR